MKKYEKLELQVKEIQKEIERLKQEEKELPIGFNRYKAIEFLETFKQGCLEYCFSWSNTPQGLDYWKRIQNNLKDPTYKVPQEAIIQIQKWIIISFQQEQTK
jgi:hypothetical protein